MALDPALLAAEISPFVSAAVGAYGSNVLADAHDEASDPTASLGRRVLQRILRAQHGRERLVGPLGDLLAAPEDEDRLAAVRFAIRRELIDDPALTAELGSMMVGGQRVIQQVQAGRDAYVAGRDQTMINYRRSDA
jgi:hypothetical protein